MFLKVVETERGNRTMMECIEFHTEYNEEGTFLKLMIFRDGGNVIERWYELEEKPSNRCIYVMNGSGKTVDVIPLYSAPFGVPKLDQSE